jgi:hypothetical protein
MSRNALMTIALSILVGTGLGTTLSGFRTPLPMTPTRHPVMIEHVGWGDAGGEKGEVEAPRGGDQGSEQGEVEAPRA